jgi:hypothetical protein
MDNMAEKPKETIVPAEGRMRPIIIVGEGVMDEKNMQMLRDNGLCVVMVSSPEAVKFLDTIPAMMGRSLPEQAAIKLSRKLFDERTYRESDYETSNGGLLREDVARMYADILIKGTELDPEPTKAERERKIYDDSRDEEIRKIAREEAREEAARRKAEKAKQVKAAAK